VPDDLTDFAGDDPSQVYRHWAGRWVLVGEDALHADACCALGCFYRNAGDAVWISSSPALINDLPGVDPAPEIGPPLPGIGKGMDWYPPPASRFVGIARLLPSQTLDLRDGTVHGRGLPAPVPQSAPYADLIDTAAGLLKNTVAAYAEAGGELWLPLTGGYDSRLVLAAAVAVGAPVLTYTFERPGMSAGDRELPARLSELVGVQHRFLRPRFAADGERELLFDVHCAGHSIEIDRQYFARGAWDQLPEWAVLLRGGVFEVARGFYHARFPAELPPEEEAVRLLTDVFQLDRFHNGSTAHRLGICEFLAWLRANPEAGLDWRDRMYMEQTVAGWLASAAQALDLFSPELAYPGNSHELLSVLLSIDPEARRASRHHVDLIERLAPPLAVVPFNPRDSRPAQVASLVRREAYDLTAFPRRRLYFRHRARWIRKRLGRKRT
jgi:hypothetical protein